MVLSFLWHERCFKIARNNEFKQRLMCEIFNMKLSQKSNSYIKSNGTKNVLKIHILWFSWIYYHFVCWFIYIDPVAAYVHTNILMMPSYIPTTCRWKNCKHIVTHSFLNIDWMKKKIHFIHICSLIILSAGAMHIDWKKFNFFVITPERQFFRAASAFQSCYFWQDYVWKHPNLHSYILIFIDLYWIPYRLMCSKWAFKSFMTYSHSTPLNCTNKVQLFSMKWLNFNRLVKFLAEKELLVPRTIGYTNQQGERVNVGSFYALDEEKFNGLSDEDFLEMFPLLSEITKNCLKSFRK